MATTPSVQSVESTPITRSDTDYNPIIEVNEQPQIAPAYASLPAHKKSYALEAWKQGIPESGKRLANCLLCGSVFARTKFNRKLALAHKFPCGELCCENCNRATYRLRKWMARRDAERIYASKLAGIEISIPYTLDYLADRDKLHELIKLLLLWLGVRDTAVFDMAPDSRSIIRVVLQCDGLRDCPAIRVKVRELGGPDVHVGFNHPEGVTGQHAKRLLSWALAGMECISTWPVQEQVAFRKLTTNLALIRTTGSHFRRLTDEEVKARHEAEQHKLIESMERKGWQMEFIPHNQRIVERCDAIDDQYERVEYRVEFEETNVYSHTFGTPALRAGP